jgi:hypothetical protein
MTGCDSASHDSASNTPATLSQSSGSQASRPQAETPLPAGKNGIASLQAGKNDLLKVADHEQLEPTIPDVRKIIRNGELTIESDNPADGQRRIASIAEGHGGFVVKSEISQSDSSNGSPQNSTVSLVIRVPFAHFNAAIEEIRGTGKRVAQEKTTGEDVTEQYVDLEARIKTKKAMELQFLEILKQARTVSDALEVQTQVANVRTEIEQLEGKRRLLENQSALSTITVNLRPPTPIVTVNTPGIVSSIKGSFADGADLAVAIVLGVVRFIILAVPIFVLILLPLGLITKFVYSGFLSRMNLFDRGKDGTEIEQH